MICSLNITRSVQHVLVMDSNSGFLKTVIIVLVERCKKKARSVVLSNPFYSHVPLCSTPSLSARAKFLNMKALYAVAGIMKFTDGNTHTKDRSSIAELSKKSPLLSFHNHTP